MPTPEVSGLIRRPFDTNLVYDMYMMKSDPELTYTHFMPLVWIVLMSEFRGAQDDWVEELISAGMIALYNSLRRRKCEERGRCSALNEFILYHYAVVRRAMYQQFAESRVWYERCIGIEPATMPKPWHRELDIYLSQLPAELENLVMERVRFEGNGYLACQYVLRCVLTQRRVVEGVIKHELRLLNVKFFVDYIMVLIRMVLYDLKGGVPVGVIREYSGRRPRIATSD